MPCFTAIINFCRANIPTVDDFKLSKVSQSLPQIPGDLIVFCEMIKASSHAHWPQLPLMLSQPVRLVPTFFCLSHSIANAKEVCSKLRPDHAGTLLRCPWEIRSPSPTSLRIHAHRTRVISSHLAVLSLSHCVYVFPCYPSHAVCPLPFPSSVPGFYPFVL